MTAFGALDEEQRELRAVVRRFCDRASPEAEVRRLMAGVDGFDPGVWKQLTEELELCGLAVPERWGGSGGGFVELGIVLTELGAVLACLPYFSTVVLAHGVLLLAGDEAATERWLPGLATGRLRGTLAATGAAGRWDQAGTEVRAEHDGAAWRLTGSASYVLDGHTADLVFVAATAPKGVSMFAVEHPAEGLTRKPQRTLDETRKQARLDFRDTPATLVGAAGDGERVLAGVLDRAVTGLAAEQVGGAQRALDMAVAYAKDRRQFGRVIGSFQAIKHKCADMLVDVESARSAAEYAAWTLDRADEDPERRAEVASMAKALCSEAYFRVARENLQVHGGIGFTWEHPAHLYFKRAKSSELLFGHPDEHRERVARRIASPGSRA
jgi:alkylation response protein AidB-like acyl-CoA dehydrogenase